MRTISQIAGDLMLDAAERRSAPPEPPAPRDEATPGGRVTQMELIDLKEAIPARSRVDRFGAWMSSDFIACVTVKARTMRSLPVHVMRKGPHGPEKAVSHPLNMVLRRPNALMTWGDLAAWAVLRRDSMGNAYMRAYRDPYTGNVREIRPVLAGVHVDFDRTTGTAVYSAPQDYYNDAWQCREDDLVILKTDVSDDGGRTGKSIAQVAAEDIGLSVDLTRFYRALLENGNHFKGYLETDSKLTLEDVKEIQQSLDTTKGPENAGQIRIFDRGLKYKAVTAAIEHMDIVAQEKWVLEKVCRACHVDKHHVYADDGAPATAASGADLDFAKNTMLPEVEAFEEALQVLIDRSRSLGGAPSDYYVKFNMTGLERADTKTRYEAHRIAVYAGIYTRARACELEDMPWLPGQDKLLQPTAYYMVDENGEPYIPGDRTAGTSGQSDGISGIDRKAVGDRMQAVIDSACNRVAKRAAADGDTPRTRAFAAEVMRPVAYLADTCGVEFDMEKAISREIGRGTGNE